MIYDSPRRLAQFLEERGFSLKKRLGQNFLVSPGARERVLALLDPMRERFVWEIGGGIGSLTHRLVGAFDHVAVFELDHGFARVLAENFGGEAGCDIVEGDFLDSWRDALRRFGRPDAIVGNLPYRSAAPIIATLTEWEEPVAKAIFTVQREVARRIAAPPGTKDRSSFSLLCQSLFEVRLHGDIAPRSFFPAPQVVSSIVSLVPAAGPCRYDRPLFAQVVRDLFASRRKTIRNNLLSGTVGNRFGSAHIDSALRVASIDPGARGERLSVAEVAALVEALSASPRSGGEEASRSASPH